MSVYLGSIDQGRDTSAAVLGVNIRRSRYTITDIETDGTENFYLAD